MLSLAGEERKSSIMNLLNEHGKVIANDLAKLFDVSTETIRRDLDELERDNKLKKVYGGAIKLKVEVEPTLFERSTIHLEAKEKIGYLASRLIEDNDVIFIDEGTTPLQILPYLMEKDNVKVLTSSISALMALIDLQKKDQFNGSIILMGGEVNVKHLRITGAIAESNMGDIFVNKAFLTVDGISLERGFTSYDYEKAALTRKWIKQSGISIMLVDSSKWDKISMAQICELDQMDIIISEKEPAIDWLMKAEALNIRWITP